jgi:PPP family 3-phenylpropionic acid transporter
MTFYGRPEGVPYWRLSGFYFLFFITIGIFLPYWPLYLESIGLDVVQIGILSAIVVFTKIFAAYFWGWVVDHTSRRMQVIRIASLLAAVTFAAALPLQGFWPLLLVLLVFSVFWSATLPQMDAATLTHLGESTHGYAGIRLWGSIGFIFSVWSLGLALEYISISRVPLLILASLVIVWLASLAVPQETSERYDGNIAGLKYILASREVMAFFGICFLMLASHGPYYTFYSIYLEDHGYSKSVTGELWALGVIAEVFVFLCMRRLLGMFRLKILLVSSLLFATLRWLLIGFLVDSMVWLLVAQVLHAATFGLYHAVAIQYVHRFFKGRLQGRGQALYSSASFGAGMAVGSLFSGYIWSSAGAGICFAVASGLSFLATLIACYWIRD